MVQNFVGPSDSATRETTKVAWLYKFHKVARRNHSHFIIIVITIIINEVAIFM